MSDAELLHRYTREQSQEAFAALVQRHLDLVYSAALRQLRSAHLAEDVAQSVFIDLARHAHRLEPTQPLAAWLYLVTRRTAVDTIRRETRRVAREQTAAEIAAMKTPPPSWSQIADSLDEAMETLNEAERTAVVLRFFQNLSLREVGAVLGISEDTAQKRVSRALDRLRSAFIRRGIALSAASLACDLSAHAAMAAPSGLGASIAAASAAAALPPVAATAAASLAMTTAQKIFAAASLALAVGGGLYQASALARQADSLHTLASHVTELRHTLARLHREHDTTTRALATVQSSPKPASPSVAIPGTDAALEAEMQAWMERAVQLELLLAERPGQTIPEMRQYLTEEDLFDHALTAKLGSEAEIRETLAHLRHYARNAFGNRLPEALRAYLAAHGNVLPASPGELLPYFTETLDPAILARYRMTASGKLDEIPRDRRRAALIEEIAAVDELYDSRLQVSQDGFSLGPFDGVAASTRAALRNFRKANGNAAPLGPAQLLPYFDPPLPPREQQVFLEKAERYLAAP